jgi:hypothetical protein
MQGHTHNQKAFELGNELGITMGHRIGYAFGYVTAKAPGWTFGAGQLGLGGAALGVSAACIYNLMNISEKEKTKISNNQPLSQALGLGATAALITIPVSCILIFKGIKNIWNT